MPFARPTLPDLVSRISADFKSRLSLVSAPLRRSVVYVASRVVAGAVHMLHGHMEFLGKQIFADISEDEYLVRQAGLYGRTKAAATFATGTVDLTGTNGTVVPIGSVLRRSDGAEYETTGEVTIANGVAEPPVTAVLAGADGNADSGVVLTFESPTAGIDAEATVTVSGLTGGADQESTDALRTRLLQRLQNPPEGGAEEDYRSWALEVDGVTRVWVYPRANGAGTVVVRFMRDDDVGGGFPSVGEVTDVQTYIDTLRPVTADVTVLAPVAKSWNFTIAVTPNTTAVRDAVEAELEDLFLREGEPGETVRLWKVEAAIANANGLTDYTLTTPAADLTHAAGELPTVGTITWS